MVIVMFTNFVLSSLTQIFVKHMDVDDIEAPPHPS
jgi:hypothetical protein